MNDDEIEATDDLRDFLEEQQEDPEFRAHFEDAAARARLLRDLLARRGASGLSQAAVARAMGTTQSAVSDIEAGGTDPRFSTLQRYARAVHCRLETRVVPDAVGRLESSDRLVGFSTLFQGIAMSPVYEGVSSLRFTHSCDLWGGAYHTSRPSLGERPTGDEPVLAS